MDGTSASERLPDLAIVLALDDALLEASDSWEAVFGEPLKAALERPIFETALAEAFGESDCALLKAHLDSVRQGRGVELLALSIVHPVLGARRLQAHAHRNPADVSQVTLVLLDTTEHWDQLSRLSESERRFGTVAAASRDLVTETDFASGRFTYVSAAVVPVLGYTPAQLVGTSALALHHPEDASGFVEDVRSRSVGVIFSVRPHRLRRCDGSWVWVESTGVRFRRPAWEGTS